LDRPGRPGQECRDKTTGTGQPGKESRDWIVGTGRPGQDWTGKGGQVDEKKDDRTAVTRREKLWQNSQDTTAGPGQSGNLFKTGDETPKTVHLQPRKDRKPRPDTAAPGQK
jgi:hypothetical protein